MEWKCMLCGIKKNGNRVKYIMETALGIDYI